MPELSRVLVLLAVFATFFGCAGAIQNQARKTASVDHGCPLDQVSVISDASATATDYAYWLNVCGKRRFYMYQQTTSAGGGAGRFLDDTQRFQPQGTSPR